MTMHETMDPFLLEVVDPRVIQAKQLFDETENQTHLIRLFKTTRAGATMSLCAENCKRGELLTILPKTNRVIVQTIKADLLELLKEKPNIVHITANSFCPRLMEQIKKYPQLERLGILPLPDCDHCKISLEQCPVRYAFETPVERINVYCITYAKLLSLMLSESKKVKELLDKVFTSRTWIFDETHYLQEVESPTVVVWSSGVDLRQGFQKKFAKLSESSSIMNAFLQDATHFLDNMPVEDLLKEREERYEKHLAMTITNPLHRFLEKIVKVAPGEDWLEKVKAAVAGLNKEYFSRFLFGFEFPQIMRVQGALMKIITQPEQYDVTEEDIIMLSNLLFILPSTKVTISYVKGLEGENVFVQAENSVFYKVLKNVMKRILEGPKRRVIFTTGTFPSLRLEELLKDELGEHQFEGWIWGDPKNTAEKCLVITDKAKVSPYNFRKRKQAIVNLILAVTERYGRENVQVLTMNKRWSGDLYKELKPKGFAEGDFTWYGSDLTEGIRSKKRIWIAIGLAERPVNSKDHLAEVQAPFHENPLGLTGKDLYYHISQKLRKESVHIHTYQALSRAKDPENRDRSLVITIGAARKDVDDCLTWGPNRKLVPTKEGFDVSIDQVMSKPKITTAPLLTDVEESLFIIDQWLKYGKVYEYRLNWAYLKKLVDRRGYISVKRVVNEYKLPREEVQRLFNQLPQLFIDQGISGYVLLKTKEDQVKAVATEEVYRKQSKPCILINRKGLESVNADWFISLVGATAKAENQQALTSRYFANHVSYGHWLHYSQFLEVLRQRPSLCPGWIVVDDRLIRDLHCLGAWSTSFPRRACKTQFWVSSIGELHSYASGPASKADFFVSVYSFPDHMHPSEGGNPPVDTLFTDLDLESERFSELRRAWEAGDHTVLPELLALREKLLNEVLHQARVFVNYLIQCGIQPRILLSGFKGVHIFIDFPSVQFSSLPIAKHILSRLMDKLKTDTGVAFDPTVVGDVSRLCRIPNTLHFDASKLLGRAQYAVPVTVEELMNLTPEGYDQLCSAPRLLPVARKESHEVLVMLTKITEDMDLDEVAVIPKGSIKDLDRLEAYERECTREILTDEDFEDLNIRPCFKRVRRERISLDGPGGHLMRIGAVMELAAQELSIPSIVRWFNFCLDYDPVITEAAVQSIISRGYTDKHVDEYGREYRKGLRCTTIQRCGYCIKEDCHIYRRRK